jgi:hypothetical protein
VCLWVEVVEVVENDREVRVFICDDPGMSERTDPRAHLLSLLLHVDLQASRGFESKVSAATYCSTMCYAMVYSRCFQADYSGTNTGLIPQPTKMEHDTKPLFESTRSNCCTSDTLQIFILSFRDPG